MSIQAQFNNAAIAMLPLTHEYICDLDHHTRNNAINLTLRIICNSHLSFEEMNAKQLDAFDRYVKESIIFQFVFNK